MSFPAVVFCRSQSMHRVKKPSVISTRVSFVMWRIAVLNAKGTFEVRRSSAQMAAPCGKTGQLVHYS
jgi:hypothetical protein